MGGLAFGWRPKEDTPTALHRVTQLGDDGSPEEEGGFWILVPGGRPVSGSPADGGAMAGKMQQDGG